MAVEAPIIQVVLQRYDADCGVAVLAMICGVSYEDALLALGNYVPDVLERGVWVKDMERAAKRLGYRMRRRRAIDWEEDTGALNVASPLWRTEHLVVLRVGMIIDTDGTLWNSQDYLRAKRARHGLLLVPEPIAKDADRAACGTKRTSRRT